MRKSALEIINETAEYYISDPSRRATEPHITLLDGGKRSITRQVCVYNKKDNKKCAVSRYLKNENEDYRGVIYDLVREKFSRSLSLYDLTPTGLLKEEVEGFSIQFWSDIQQIHDCSTHWDENGITGKGISFIESLRKKYIETKSAYS